MTAETTTQSPVALLSTLGVTLEASPPRAGVDGDWPHIAYAVTLKRGDKAFWSGPYKLGVGHVKIPQGFVSRRVLRLAENEESLLLVLQHKPHAKALNPMTHASLAAKLAVAQKVAPKLADVVYSLLLDGSAHFDSLTFEDWCGEFGRDTDSRKAEQTFRQCEEIGKAIARAFSRDELDQLREAFREY